ncbi:Uncharacterised protein [Mycobacterium tuberculosis]|uniref:Uncharacterized protein n=1 Tax=Mycobacterium tuberculosis TaxID=1773 RepID=A0A916LAZ7_MYCTX|nr:Uncharacterised protein [Mycobacterium tuberculosis]
MRIATLRNHRPNRVRVAKNQMNFAALACLPSMKGRRRFS